VLKNRPRLERADRLGAELKKVSLGQKRANGKSNGVYIERARGRRRISGGYRRGGEAARKANRRTRRMGLRLFVRPGKWKEGVRGGGESSKKRGLTKGSQKTGLP